MINLKVNYDGEGTEVNCEVHIEGLKAAKCEFYAVLKSLENATATFYATHSKCFYMTR